MKTLRVKRLHPDAKLPTRAHQYDAGLDLYALKRCFINLDENGEPTVIETGVAVEIQPGFVGLILPRSSMSRDGVLTATGVVDCGYTGEIRVMLSRTDDSWFQREIKAGDRIAQFVIVPVSLVDVQEVEELTAWGTRGDGGFGSTGR